MDRVGLDGQGGYVDGQSGSLDGQVGLEGQGGVFSRGRTWSSMSGSFTLWLTCGNSAHIR